MPAFPSKPRKQGTGTAKARSFYSREGAPSEARPVAKGKGTGRIHTGVEREFAPGVSVRSIRNKSAGIKCGSKHRTSGSVCIRRKGHTGGHASKGNAWV
jgi:hypothetical protein